MFFIIEFTKLKTLIKRIIFGIAIGASMMIPGFSGGTAAIILGVFYEIMKSVSELLTDFKKSLKFLLPFAIGGIIGVFLVCYPLKFIISNYEIYFSYLIIGVIIGSIGCFVPKNKFKTYNLLWVLLGIMPVVLQQILSEKYILNSKNYLMLIIVGIFSSVALILPGISLTNILISFGYYENLINSIINLDILFISVYFLSLIFGIVISIKIIMKLYNKYTEKMNLILLGMILSSISQIYSGLPQNNQIIPCVLLFISGICLSIIVSRFEK